MAGWQGGRMVGGLGTIREPQGEPGRCPQTSNIHTFLIFISLVMFPNWSLLFSFSLSDMSFSIAPSGSAFKINVVSD